MLLDTLERLQEQLMTLSRNMERQRASSRNVSCTPSSKLIDCAELCQELNISRRTLYNYIEKYAFPVYRIGQKYYFRLDEVYTYMMKARKN